MTAPVPLAFRFIRRALGPVGILCPWLGRWMQRRGPCHNLPPYVTEERLAAGLVLVLPGIEGPGLFISGLRDGLVDGGVPAAIEICNWAQPRLGAAYAFDPAAARARAGELIARIGQYRHDWPGRPVVLVGMSGGAAMVIVTAELLAAAGAAVEGVASLAPPLSPDYDLTTALAGVAGELVVFHSPRDIQLRTLTTLGQNFDGVRGRPAGQVGFAVPDASRYRRLRQVSWDEAMRATGHRGEHSGWTRRPWSRAYLAPIVRQWLAGPTVAPAPAN